MKRFSAGKWMILFLAIAVSGCSSINSIHGYTSAATDGASNFDLLDYSFQQSCFDRCRLDAVRHRSIQRDTACSCTLYKQADSTTRLLYNAVISYLIELNTLSSKNLTTYNLDALQLAISYGDFAPLHLSDRQVNAYMTLSRLLLQVADLHRMKELRQFIVQANPSFQVLIKTLQFILTQNLESELAFRKESLFAYYKAMSLNPALSDYEKGRLVQDYYRHLSDIHLPQKKIEILDQTLSQIAAGHQQMADHIHTLSSAKIKSQIMQNTVNIQGLTDTFKSLK